MSSSEASNAIYRPYVEALAAALESADEDAFRQAFAGLRECMDSELTVELRKITAHGKLALQRFREEARIDALAGQEVPDARKRLAHVVEITDEAAHRTLDLVEQSGPLVDRCAEAAIGLLEEWNRGEDESWTKRAHEFIERTAADTDLVRAQLTQMLLAQGYQDITGQIIRGVIGLVDELEAVLGDLVRITEGREITRKMPRLNVADLSRGVGPQVRSAGEGAVSAQDDIDALLKSVGLD